MSVRAKFKVDSVTHHECGGSVKLVPVTNGSAENAQFFKHTPWGSIEIGIINDHALNEFVPGTECYVDFTSCIDMTGTGAQACSSD